MRRAVTTLTLTCIPFFSYAEPSSKTDAQNEEFSRAFKKFAQAVNKQNKDVLTAGILFRDYANETGYLSRCVSGYEQPDIESLVSRYMEWAELEKNPEFKDRGKELAEKETFSIKLIFTSAYMTAECTPSMIHTQRAAADSSLSEIEYLFSKPIEG